MLVGFYFGNAWENIPQNVNAEISWWGDYIYTCRITLLSQDLLA